MVTYKLSPYLIGMYLYLYFIVLLDLIYHIKGEYLIRGEQVPSYLYHKFDNVKEEIFPLDIRIKMSLTRVSGTLLYSIDSRLNQLIVTLYEAVEVTISIEFRRREYGVSLRELCGCERCRFEIFDLKISLADQIILQCNERPEWKKGYSEIVDLNEAYILPYKNTKTNLSSTNEAHIWLVNNPKYDNVYPNNDQMSGCIFSVLYNNAEFTFKEVSNNIESHCSKICDDQICNGGRCYETYHSDPLCNCSMTFLNGPYCNDTLLPINVRSSKYVIFEVFKLSWQSTSNIILSLDNSNVHLRLHRSEKILYLQINSKWRTHLTNRHTLTDLYEPMAKYILICYFSGDNIGVKFYDNGNWYGTVMWAGRKMWTEVFTSVTLRSGNGTMQMMYKTSVNDDIWRTVPLTPNGTLEEEGIPSYRNESIELHKESSTARMETVVSVSIVCVVLGFVVVLIPLYLRRQRKLRETELRREIYSRDNELRDIESRKQKLISELKLREDELRDIKLKNDVELSNIELRREINLRENELRKIKLREIQLKKENELRENGLKSEIKLKSWIELETIGWGENELRENDLKREIELMENELWENEFKREIALTREIELRQIELGQIKLKRSIQLMENESKGEIELRENGLRDNRLNRQTELTREIELRDIELRKIELRSNELKTMIELKREIELGEIELGENELNRQIELTISSELTIVSELKRGIELMENELREIELRENELRSRIGWERPNISKYVDIDSVSS